MQNLLIDYEVSVREKAGKMSLSINEVEMNLRLEILKSRRIYRIPQSSKAQWKEF